MHIAVSTGLIIHKKWIISDNILSYVQLKFKLFQNPAILLIQLYSKDPKELAYCQITFIL